MSNTYDLLRFKGGGGLQGIFVSLLAAFFFLSLGGPSAMAQETTVTGTVTAAETGQPLPGVNVVVQGTSIGATTEADGTFEVTAPSLEVTLEFSFVGYQTKEVPLDGRTEVQVTLQQTAVAAEEVVVTAFGSQQRTEVTGSISSIDGEDVANISGTSLDKALQGQISGLQMTQGGASPTAKSRVLIRGVGSIQGGTEPLFVIDGMPVAGPHTGGDINPMSLVNPNDIESIEVLKDAAATALYGSRGSSGVVLITTKDGGAEGQFNVSYKTGRTSPTDTYDLVGTERWFEVMDQAKANNPNDLDQFDPTTGDYTFSEYSDDEVTRSEALQNNNDYLDKVTQTGQFHDLNVSFGGGNNQGSTYYVSANYRTEESYLKDNDMDRFLARGNADIKPIENLTAGLRTNLSYIKQDEAPIGGGAPGGNRQLAKANWGAAVNSALPWLPVRKENGDFFAPLSGNNVVATLNQEGGRDWFVQWNRQLRALGKLYADYQLPFFEQLTIHAEGSADYTQTKSLESSTADLRPPSQDAGYGGSTTRLNWSFNYNGYGTYQDNFGPHEVKLTAGAEMNTENLERTFVETFDRTATDEYLGSNLQTTEITRLFDNRFEEQIFFGYFGRLNYNYEGRYLAQFSFRRDGSTRFGIDRRVGNFPAGAVGWVVSEESFMDGIETLNYLKLRASYGETGNSAIPGDVTEESWGGWRRYGTTANGRFLSGGIAASEVGWETTKSTDISVEYGLFQDRITGSVAWYRQDVEGLLLNAPTAASGGAASSIWGNVGDLTNQGWEFEIESRNIVQGDFNWTTSFNLTLNSNEVNELTSFLAENNSGLNQGRTLTRIGNPIGGYHIAKSAGIDPETGYEMIYEVDTDPFLVGDPDGDDEEEFLDQEGNIVEEENRVKNPNYLETTGDLLPATESNVSQNRVLMEDKTGNPTYFGGLTNRLSYKGVNLSFTFNFQGGNYIYDSALQGLTNAGGPGNFSEEYVGNYWTPDNRDAKYPKPSWQNQYRVENQDVDSDGEPESGVQTFSTNTSNYLYEGDYIRLRRVRLGYDVPQSLIGNVNMRRLNVYVSASNLWTYAPDYPGLSPAVTSFDGNNRARNLQPGIVGSSFTPPTRRVTVGINLGF
jgi:TonB-linked SusC/RagA family outer membrane protein